MRGLRSTMGAVLLVVTAAAACSSVVSEAPNLDRLMGAWVLQGSDPDGVQRVYARQDSLCGEQNGYAFASDGVLLVRDAGWCLTPPVVYFNHEGSWVCESDRVLVLTHWFGKKLVNFRFEVLTVDDQRLVCHVTPLE